ncbi:hypothetical protein IV102_11000 [bacterium]|nr:hypothetical protein [bacterium]
MLLPLLGLVLFAICLLPFAAILLGLCPKARNLISLVLFFVGSGLWLFMIGTTIELVQDAGVRVPNSSVWLYLTAPLGGALLAWLKDCLGHGPPLEVGSDGDIGPSPPIRVSPRYMPGMALTAWMLVCFPLHFYLWGSLDYTPNFTKQDLMGEWIGEEGRLVLAETGFRCEGGHPETGTWNRDINDLVTLGHGVSYRVARRSGRFYLITAGDPDDASIAFRKVH